MRSWIPAGKPRYTKNERIPEGVYRNYRANLNQVKPEKRNSKVRSVAFRVAWQQYIKDKRK